MNLLSSLEIQAHRSDQEQRAGKTEPRFRIRIVTGNVEENQAEREINKIFVFEVAAAHDLILSETEEYASRPAQNISRLSPPLTGNLPLGAGGKRRRKVSHQLIDLPRQFPGSLVHEKRRDEIGGTHRDFKHRSFRTASRPVEKIQTKTEKEELKKLGDERHEPILLPNESYMQEKEAANACGSKKG